MENYLKGEVVEIEMDKPFDLLEHSVEMKVNSGSKIRNLLTFAMKKFKEPDVKQMTWSGSGNAMNKAITCAEIMKRKIKDLHQVSQLTQKRIEEYWDPKIEGLDRLKVNRDIPAICILLSKEALDKQQEGYQGPGSTDMFWKSPSQQLSHFTKHNTQQRERRAEIDTKKKRNKKNIDKQTNKRSKKCDGT